MNIKTTLVRVAVSATVLTALVWSAGPAVAQQPQPQPPSNLQPGADNDYFMATWFYNSGKWVEAVEEYSKFLKRYPEHKHAGDAQLGLAQALFQLGKYPESAEAFKKLLSQYNTDQAAEATFQLAQAYLGAKQFDKATAAFADFSGKFKTHYLAEWADAKRAECLVSLAQSQADPDDAAKLYAQAEPLLEPLVAKYVRSDKAAEAMAAQTKQFANPKLASAFETLIVRGEWYLALSQFGQKKYALSADSLGRFADGHPSNPLAESARLHQAQSLFLLGKFAEAASVYDQIVQAKGPLAGTACFERAHAIYKSADRSKAADPAQQKERDQANAVTLKKAADAFIACARDYPKTDRAGRARLYAGNCLYEAGDFAGAINQFEAIIQSKTPVAVDEAKFWKGKAQLQLGLVTDAAATFAEAIRSHPGSPRVADMRLAQADALLDRKDYDEAATAYEAFVAAFPQNEAAPRALHTAARARHKAKQWVDSNKLCARFLADYAKHELAPKVLFIQGENYFLLRNYSRAGLSYKQRLENYPADNSDPETDAVRLRLGWTMYFQAQYEQALPVLEAIGGAAEPDVRAEAVYLRANCLFELKRDVDAVKAFNAYLELKGEKSYGDDALFKIALLQARGDKPAGDSIDALQRLAKEHPDSPLRAQAEFQLGEMQLRKKNYAAAVGHYQEVVKRDAKGALAPYSAFAIGLAYYEQSMWKEAADAFAGVASNYPNESKLAPQALYRQGLSLQKIDQWALADNAFNDLLKRYPTDPYAPSAMMAMGLGQQQRELTEKAAATFAKLIASYHDWQGLDKAYYELAWCHKTLGNKPQELDAWAKLARNYPESPIAADANYYLAEQQYQIKEFGLARDLYQKALAASKDDRIRDKALYRLGWCYWFDGKYAESAEQFDRIVADHPNSPLLATALLNGGEAHLRADKPQQAADRLAKLVSGPAGQNFEHLPSAYLRLGEAQLKLGQADKSLVTFSALRQKYPEFKNIAEVDAGIGQSQFKLKRYDDALKSLNAVLTLPASRIEGDTAAKAQFYVGECHMEKGEPREALKAFLRVTVLPVYQPFPEWLAASHYELGRVYRQLDDKIEARTQFQTVVEKYPKTSYATLAKKQLDELK